MQIGEGSAIFMQGKSGGGGVHKFMPAYKGALLYKVG